MLAVDMDLTSTIVTPMDGQLTAVTKPGNFSVFPECSKLLVINIFQPLCSTGSTEPLMLAFLIPHQLSQTFSPEHGIPSTTPLDEQLLSVLTKATSSLMGKAHFPPENQI
jgi:hypothetical protein